MIGLTKMAPILQKGLSYMLPAPSKSTALHHAVAAALFSALIIVLTAVCKIPFGVGGYIHLGDAFIYLAASLLPLPYAAAASALGGAAADILSGYPAWAPFSLVIKLLLTVCFTGRGKKILCTRNLLAAFLGIPITVIGYYFSEVILYGNWAAFASIPWNLLQGAASAAVYILLALTLDRVHLKQKRF